ncbi:RagB/SusD domain protein [Pseudopedobacter saltans DSM 12145]|uniref:RagB/SusD domain protein n=1 Tax=Pseudopedobacter saltans (strain ATCC 51119 / DSM 12145 / JCM 21818 / CCUG 39354 / LMG 10337 / NBRC 100064 / NCIMB 13643) TaxID=762903 RepID=F0S5B5_PSESL|nr:RagB/SusD family nutrient uptake outer membrane protein [Pseudopedobacter saltans]ADY52060.1 RagB/SusD domain protein [Pseudopedobacter saltans DSM 12145]
MKKIFSTAILSLIISFTSCNKAIDEQPISEGTLKDFFKSKLDADAAIAGMYGEFQHTMIGEGQFQNRITWWGEARSDNWETRSAYATSSTNEIHLNGLTENNAYADWSPLYSTIGRANLILKNLPLIKNYVPVGTIGALSLAQEDSYRAQSLAMRALCYFWIVRIWGDAPLRTEPYESIHEKAEQARDPQAKILDQCIKDLEEAYALTVKNATPTVWYLGEGAICSIMADIYMWKKDYPNAVIWFKRLFAAKAPTGKVYNAVGKDITGAGGAVADLQAGLTWNQQFTNPAGSLESIFSIHWNYIANGCACMSGVSRTTNENTIRMGTELWTTWPTVSTAVYGSTTATTDLRVKQTYNMTNATNQPIRDRSFWKFYAGTYVAPTATAGYNFTLQKYDNNLPATTETDVFIPIYRLSGMYLLYAEALNKIGDRNNAVKYLNLIKTRAGVPTVVAANYDENTLEKEILKERQFELIGEGVRWFDLVRTDRVKEVMDPILITRQANIGNAQIGFGTDKKRYYWPLSLNVLNSNRLLVQNDPYKN